MKKRNVVIICCVIGYIIYALLTGGIYVTNYDSFGGQRDVVFVKGLKSDLHIDCNWSSSGIVFVGFAGTTKLPYSLRVQLRDFANKYASITVETVIVEYPDGSEKTIKPSWFCKLKKSIHGENYVSSNIEDIIDRRSDCKVRLIGFITTVSGEQITFDLIEAFKYYHRSEITTYWKVLANI